nr:hypothetical protein [uncultured Vibrio sp.]
MADKLFIVTCNPLKRHKDNQGAFVVPVTAGKITDAELIAMSRVLQLDPIFEGGEHVPDGEVKAEYRKWYQAPDVKRELDEEVFNQAVIDFESNYQPRDEEQLGTPDLPFPVLGNDGFYDTEDPQVEESSFASKTDETQTAKVFVLRVGYNQYAYGFRYTFGDFDKHERMNLDRIEEKRDDAVDKAVGRLETFLGYQDEFGAEEQKPFISALMQHDFYRAFLEPSELFIEALSKHPDVTNALEQHGDFFDVVEGHFADVWPLDKSPEQAIEHVNSMVTIGVLYDLEALTESFKPYLPSSISEKALESMKRIEAVIDKPAANDPAIEPKCWKAALPVTDDLHVVIAIQDCSDEGWRNAFEGNLKTERAFGDANNFSSEFATTRKEAIKMAGQAIVDALYKYDTSLILAKTFMKSPYLQDFEDNCIEVTAGEETDQIEDSEIEMAIRERLARRPAAKVTDAEVKFALDSITPHITVQTNISELANAIGRLEKCGILFNEDDAAHLVAGYTVATNEQITHNTENEHECFIAEILSRIGDEGSSYLTSEQYEEAGEKLATVIDELVGWYDGQREHNGKFLTFVKDKTLENIAEIDFDDPNEVSKTFLNIRSLRAAFSENIELIENSKPASEQADKLQKTDVDHPALLKAITERLAKESHAVTPERAYTQLSKIITENTDIYGLADFIKQIKNPVIIWHSTESVNLVMKFTSQNASDAEEETKASAAVTKETNYCKGMLAGSEKEKEQAKSNEQTSEEPLPQPDNDEPVTTVDNNSGGVGVPQNIVEQEPANDPEIPYIDLDESNSNMDIWNQAFKTDLNFTKQDPSTGRLSINAQYRQMKATELFGPRGKGWGVDVKREWLEDGLPIFANGTFTGVNESVHNMEVELWYIHPETGERCTVTAFGETERFYWSHNYSRMIKNGECRKKSLTDATGKALSMLGICGDVYMGEYDDENIITRSQMTKTTDNALRKLEFDAQATQQAFDKAKSYTDKFSTAPSLAEIKRLQKLAETALEAIPTHDAESKAKKGKALSRIAEQAEAAIKDFQSDMKCKEQAND